MIGSIILLIYLIFCVLVAYAGRQVAIGFWGVLVMSIFLTPLLTAILIVILRPRSKKKKKDEWDELDELEYLDEY